MNEKIKSNPNVEYANMCQQFNTLGGDCIQRHDIARCHFRMNHKMSNKNMNQNLKE